MSETAEEIWSEAWAAFKRIHGSQEADIATAVTVIDRRIRSAVAAQKEKDARVDPIKVPCSDCAQPAGEPCWTTPGRGFTAQFFHRRAFHGRRIAAAIRASE